MKKLGEKTLGIEGMAAGRWVLLDYGDIVVHVFLNEIRRLYDLDGLWSDAPRLDLDLADDGGALAAEGEPG